MKKLIVLFLSLLFITGCSVTNQSTEIASSELSDETGLITEKTVLTTVPAMPNTSDISTETTNKTFNYTVQEGDTFFSIAVSLYPDRDLSAAADTLRKFNADTIDPGDVIVCPNKEDIPNYHIVIARSHGAFDDIAYYDAAKDENNKHVESINQELGIESTDFLVVRNQGEYKHFHPVDKNADEVLYAYQKDDKWGLINGYGKTVMAPTHAMVTTLGNNKTSYYLISDNKEKPFTGMLYSVDGEKRFDFEVGLIGGGPDCDTAHIRTDVFTYEENGKLGLVKMNQEKITPAVYDFVRDDYDGAFMYGYRGEIIDYLTVDEKNLISNTPDRDLMGIGDNVDFEYSCVTNKDTGLTNIYKGDKPVFETKYRIEQIENGFIEYNESGINTYDLDFNKLHSFPKEYVYLLEGPEGAYSYSGYLMFEKEGKKILCAKNGKELISMVTWFDVVLEGDYFRISSGDSADLLYDLDGNFIGEAGDKKEENLDSSSYIYTAFSHENSYYRTYHMGWIKFVSEDFEYNFPYSTEAHFATYIVDNRD